MIDPAARVELLIDPDTTAVPVDAVDVHVGSIVPASALPLCDNLHLTSGVYPANGRFIMQSIDLIRANLTRSAERVLLRIEEMQAHGLVFPTARGGCHTTWVLGHLAYIEAQVIEQFMLGREHPFPTWRQPFDDAEPTSDPAAYPPFEQLLEACRATRAATVAIVDGLIEADLDRASARPPAGWEGTFGTYRDCLQFVADHWYMHRAHLADARRSAGVDRMWV